jgi:hypothetical protein
MSEITATRRIQHSEYEKLMEQPLPAREIEEWRSR